MTWWMWVLLGLGLLVVELVTPGGFFALFFGIGALAVALLALAGLDGVWQWLAFTVLSVGLLATVRGTLRDRLASRAGGAVDSLVGEEAVLLEDLPAGGEAKVELRGTPWSARATTGAALSRGQRTRVEKVDGLVLWVRAE